MNCSAKVQDEVDSVVPDEVDMAREVQSKEDGDDEECDESDAEVTETDEDRKREVFSSISQHLEICLKSLEEYPIKHDWVER